MTFCSEKLEERNTANELAGKTKSVIFVPWFYKCPVSLQHVKESL